MAPKETPTSSWSILDGPSREELFDALRLFDEHRLVEFCVNKEGHHFFVKTQINRIEAESGSGHNWNLVIYFPHSDVFTTLHERGPHSLYYDDKRRKGHFVISTTPATV